MRVAALYDIHGNLPALEAALDAVRGEGVDLIVVGGDVLPGPMPGEALALLRGFGLPARYVLGNGERETLNFRRGEEEGVPEPYRDITRWTARQLTDDDAAWISSWPATLRLEIPGLGKVLFCHATPRNDTDLFTRLTPEDALRPHFEGAGGSLVVCGHTHMPFDRTVAGVRVVNAGSVGMPYGEPGAYWLLLGGGVHLRRTDYNLADAARRIRETAYPQAEDFAENNVLRPHSEQEALTFFSKAEIGA